MRGLTCFVLEGEATVTDGSNECTVGAGAVVVPPDHPHGFVNSGAGRLKQIDVHLSPRFETRRLGERGTRPGERPLPLLRRAR